MAFESCAHQFEVVCRVQETIGGAMEGNQAAAITDKIHQRLLLLGRNLCVVGKDNDGIIAGQFVWVQIVEGFGVCVMDMCLGESGFELFESISRAVMSLVAEKEDANSLWVLGRFLSAMKRGRKKIHRNREGKDGEEFWSHINCQVMRRNLN